MNHRSVRCLCKLLTVHYLYSAGLWVIAAPIFDPSSLMQDILIPADAAVGSIIYRLRASDPTFDYPLKFTLRDTSYPTVSVDSLNCTRLNSLCQSNVILRRRLEIGRFYDFTVEVTNWQKRQSTALNCSFRATNATTPIADIFPGAPTLLMVSENARRNTELGVIIAKGNPSSVSSKIDDDAGNNINNNGKNNRGVLLELWGSTQFGLHQKLINQWDAQGTILLLGKLDYEQRTVHHLAILANNPYTDVATDTRNIASWPLLVAVLDEQDTPPIFTLAPPTTTLSSTLQPNDVILRVHAEDGDRGKPRDIRYGLVPEGNPFTPFFNISEDSGELRLMKPLSEILSISHTAQPILLTVIAEEIRLNPQESPAQSTSVRLALIPPTPNSGSPLFGATEYSTLLDENSPTGTVLDLPQAKIVTQPGDVITLSLSEENNGTFDIAPSVVDGGQSEFRISVHDPKLLDYERWHSVHCYIVARELSSSSNGNFTARAKLTVLLNDVNDNDPVFTQDEYLGTVQEKSPVGTTVLRVEAYDTDREPSSIVRYTNLKGTGSNFFDLHPISGLITVKNPNLDAENSSTIVLIAEARDEQGKGRSAQTQVTIQVTDVNDEIPLFEKSVYEFIVNSQLNGFTQDSAFVKATDRDVSSPNNQVHYELISTLPLADSSVIIDENTGELHITKTPWPLTEVLQLTARVWDGGVPRLSSECQIRIYPPDGQSHRMLFIVSGTNPDRESVRSTLRALTGASRVTIDEVRPYTGYEQIDGVTDVSRGSGNNKDRSLVVATVTYSKGAVVDLNRIHNILDQEHSNKNDNNNDNNNNNKNGDRDRTKTAGTTTFVHQDSGSSNLLWLLILLILLALLAVLILVLCCICQGCPLYVPPKKTRKTVRQSPEMVERLVVKGSGHGRESKSVQVAEWFGRREAWTPEQVLVASNAAVNNNMNDNINDMDESLRRHEMERGSDKFENYNNRRATLQRQSHQVTVPQQQQVHQRVAVIEAEDPSIRDQLYIREGNTDILRLITRGAPDQRPVTLLDGRLPQMETTTIINDNLQQQPSANYAHNNNNGHLFMTESGKDILMRRFIDQQSSSHINQHEHQQQQQHVFLPNAVNKLQQEHELLEASLRQQNALLRQILLDRELKDLRLETQSLPAGTQTDQDAGTQTEPELLRPPRRRVRSDNDASDLSDGDYYADDVIVGHRGNTPRTKKHRQHHHGNYGGGSSNRRTTTINKYNIRRKIRTPIQEESEIETQTTSGEKKVAVATQKQQQEVSNTVIRQTRTSQLRQQKLGSSAGPTSHNKTSDDRNKSRMSRSSGGLNNKIHKEVLQEISKSLDGTSSESNSTTSSCSEDQQLSEEDSLEGDAENHAKLSKRNMYSSESDLQIKSSHHHQQQQRNSNTGNDRNGSDNTGAVLLSKSKSRSQSDLLSKINKSRVPSSNHSNASANDNKNGKSSKPDKNAGAGGSRYMEWYNKNKTNKEKKQKHSSSTANDKSKNKSTKIKKPQSEQIPLDLTSADNDLNKEDELAKEMVSRLMKDTESSQRKKKSAQQSNDSSTVNKPGPEHPLLQHSEHRFEAQYPIFNNNNNNNNDTTNNRSIAVEQQQQQLQPNKEQDVDSGIALTRPAMTQKKSIFTIAYDDVHTNQIRDDSMSPL